MNDKLLLYKMCITDPEFEAKVVSKRPLRGPQAEIIRRVEEHIAKHEGGVMTIKSARQTGKNELAAILQRRHLQFRQHSINYECWIRTAPTHKPQIVNSKKRLRELLRLGDSNNIRYPLLKGRKLHKEEGYIWRVGNAAIEFLSSGPQSSVVGATASTCLDMDEAHKVDQTKFDEDFAPFTANTNAATLLWGVGGNGLDTLQFYIDQNKENKRDDLNLSFPCEVWMDIHEPYRKHVEERVRVLGWDHPIIQTQYRLKSIASLGTFLKPEHINNLFNSEHERQRQPKKYTNYEMVVDIAAGNEDFDPNDVMSGFDKVSTDSTVIIIYEVTGEVATNNIFPVCLIREVIWLTGTSLKHDESVIESTIINWNINKCTIDAVGVGRQIAESMVEKFGEHRVNAYHATPNEVSTDCYDLLARLTYNSVKMFTDDESYEHTEFEKQAGWTQYSADKGKMKLEKPKSDKHIDMIKAMTYINQNRPITGKEEIYVQESNYE